MIVFACGALHESHSFNTILTEFSDFDGAEPGSIAAQPDLIDTRSIEGGILKAAKELGWELTFPFFTRATPSGPLSRHCFETLRDRLLAELARMERPDGVLLPMHGAMFSEGEPDCEGAIVEAVRAAVGPDVPIAFSLDPHGNMTDLMIRHADILTSYRTTPHVDQWETSYRAAHLLDAAMAGRTDPHLAVARLPLMCGLDMGRTLDPDGPMCRLQRKAREIEDSDPDVLNIEVNAGYYYGDVAETGPSVVVCSDGADPRFQQIADRLIREAWDTRAYFSLDFEQPAEAVEMARADQGGEGPLILVDFTDGPMGGAHADGTTLMSLLLEADIPGTVVGPIYDPQAAAEAIAAGTGATLTLAMGGRTDPENGGGPVTAEVTVGTLSDGNYTRKGAYSTGTIGAFGPSAAVTHGNVTVMLVSAKMQPEDREQYRIFGVDPENVNILAFKGINHFRADFEPIARRMIFVDTGGLVAVDFTRFPFRNIRRPVWPLDEVELPPA